VEVVIGGVMNAGSYCRIIVWSGTIRQVDGAVLFPPCQKIRSWRGRVRERSCAGLFA